MIPWATPSYADETMDVTGTVKWFGVSQDDAPATYLRLKSRFIGEGGEEEYGGPIDGALKQVPAGSTSVTWPDLPVRTSDGKEYIYRVYQSDSAGEEHYVPQGFMQIDDDDPLTVINVPNTWTGDVIVKFRESGNYSEADAYYPVDIYYSSPQIEEGEKYLALRDGDEETVTLPYGVNYTVVLRSNENTRIYRLDNGAETLIEGDRARGRTGNLDGTPHDPVTYIVDHHEDRFGDFEIKNKVVNGPDPDRDFEYTFLMKDGGEYQENSFSYETYLDGDNGRSDTVNREGTIKSGDTFTLKENERMIIRGLPNGATARVSGDLPDGYDRRYYAPSDYTEERLDEPEVKIDASKTYNSLYIYNEKHTEPKLSVTKTARESTVYGHDYINYIIRVTNSGDRDAKNVRMIDTLDTNLEYVNSHPPYDVTESISGNVITWETDIRAGKTIEIDISALPKGGFSGTVTNTVDVIYDGVPDHHPGQQVSDSAVVEIVPDESDDDDQDNEEDNSDTDGNDENDWTDGDGSDEDDWTDGDGNDEDDENDDGTAEEDPADPGDGNAGDDEGDAEDDSKVISASENPKTSDRNTLLAYLLLMAAAAAGLAITVKAGKKQDEH